MTTEERFEKMQPAFDAAARFVVDQVHDSGFATVVLEPGDSTCYRFILVPPRDWSVAREDGVLHRESKYWWVTLTMGRSYEWGGQFMHWDYCAEKWTEKSHPWTGRVVCALLNAIAARLVEDAEEAERAERGEEDGPQNDDWIQANLERAAFAGRPQTTQEMMLEDLALDRGFPL